MTDAHPQTVRRLAIDDHGARLQDEIVHGVSRNTSGTGTPPEDGWQGGTTAPVDHTRSLRSAATAGTVDITLDEQLALHRQHAQGAFDALVELLQMPSTRERVIDLAERRLGGIGFDEYGDAMFHQTFPELLAETDDELADAVNRMVAWLTRQARPDQQRAVFRLLADRCAHE